MLKPNRLVGVVVRDIVIRAGRGGSRRNVGDVYPPPAIFKYVFDEYSFSMISNLYRNNKSRIDTGKRHDNDQKFSSA